MVSSRRLAILNTQPPYKVYKIFPTLKSKNGCDTIYAEKGKTGKCENSSISR